MNKLFAIALSLWVAFPFQAIAADNAVTVTVGSGPTLKSKDVGGFQIMQHNLLDQAGLDVLGAVTASPTANTVLDRLKTLNATLNAPFQANGSIGNTSFGISGTLPAFTAIPAFKTDLTTPGTTNLVVTSGPNAGAATATGNPLGLGAVYRATLPTYTDGQRSEIQTGTRGSVNVTLFGQDTTAVASIVANAGNTDGNTVANGTLQVRPYNQLYNGVTWDRMPGDVTNGAFVNVKTGTVAVTQATSSSLKAQVDPLTAASWGLLAQASTTSGQVGQMAMGAVTTASPSYTTAQTSPLSLDTAGSLRVAIISGAGSGGTASNFGSAFPAAGTAIGLSDGTNMVAARQALNNNLGSIAIEPAGGTVTCAAACNGTDILAATSTGGYAGVMLNFSTFSGTSTVTFQGSADGTNYYSTVCNRVDTQGSTPATSTTFSAAFFCPSYGSFFRARFTAYTSGTVIVQSQLKANPSYFGSQGISTIPPSDATTNITKINTVTPLMGNGTTGTGSLRVTIASDNSSNTNAFLVTGTGGTFPATQATASSLNATVVGTGTFATQSSLVAATTGGCTPAKTLSAASTNATSIKGSAGTLCKLVAVNTSATIYYLKFYDKATAPTCNSDTVLATYPVPPSNSGIAISLSSFGEAYPTGIGFCLTGGLADNDNTNAATGVAISYAYK